MNNILSLETVLFLMIDIQEKLIKAQNEPEKIIKNAKILAQSIKVLKIPALITEQYPKGLGGTLEDIKTCLPDDAVFFEKTSFDCCLEDGFLKVLKGLNKKQIVVCGMESHICVSQTVNSLLREGFEVFIVQDAISSRKPYEETIGFQRMINSGAVPVCTEMVIFELLKGSKHSDFKEIQGLIK